MQDVVAALLRLWDGFSRLVGCTVAEGYTFLRSGVGVLSALDCHTLNQCVLIHILAPRSEAQSFESHSTVQKYKPYCCSQASSISLLCFLGGGLPRQVCAREKKPHLFHYTRLPRGKP